jgi:hypothetical protein
MRLDIPHEHERPRQPANCTASPLEPSEVERRRESLAARAAEDRGPAEHVKRVPRRSVSQTHSAPSRRDLSRDLPREQRHDHRPRRNDLSQQMVGVALRDEERKLLAEVGRFRVIATRDLAETVYGNRDSRMARDLTFLRQKGLIEVDAVNARRDGRGGRVEQIEVVVLTKLGRDVTRQSAGLPRDQQLYSGLVKPREVEHDAQIYRAYRKHAEGIEQRGGTNLRVKLDFELKADVQKAIHAETKLNPDRDMADIKQQVAKQFELPYIDGGIQIPDARIVYDLEQKADDIDQGPRSGYEDIEVLTAAYSPGHLRAKAQSGFHLYASASDRASVTARIEGDHHLIDNILEL